MSSYEELLEKSTALEKRQGAANLFVPAGPRLGDIVVNLEGVSKSFEGRNLYTDLSFSLPRGGIVGVIGPNGCGKSTLFRMIAGEDTPDQGKIQVLYMCLSVLVTQRGTHVKDLHLFLTDSPSYYCWTRQSSADVYIYIYILLGETVKRICSLLYRMCSLLCVLSSTECVLSLLAARHRWARQ
jgi:ATPase subunit of ABC transporter with duplicated ATPase domains